MGKRARAGRTALLLAGVLAAGAAGAASCSDTGAGTESRAGAERQETAAPDPVAGREAGRKTPRTPQTCVTIQRGGGAGDVFDTGIVNDGTGSSEGLGTSGTVVIGDTGSPDVAQQELMSFDLGSIARLPAQRYNVASAQLSLWLNPSSSDQMINVHQATAPWTETTASWASFGEQFVASPATTFDAGPANPYSPLPHKGQPNNVRVDISSLVSGWLNGSFANDGIVLEQPAVPGVATVDYTSDYASDTGLHPTLFVCYSIVCLPGTMDCNNDGSDGCETDITSAQSCGGCGNVCSVPNAAPACVNGACAIGSCNMGFGDCDGDPANGCETMLTTAASCGACGAPCALPNAASSCATGTCTLTACNPGYFDCDGNPANGCEPLPCNPGQRCATSADCSSGVCASGTCAPPSCTDGVKNENETDVDCGGSTCPPCAAGKGCLVAGDCGSGVCTDGVCQAPTCSDGVKNGAETDVDCGGTTCPVCPVGHVCAVDYDCASGVCVAGSCQAPTCNDGVRNGAETGVDCGGGACPACAAGVGCGVAADCASGVCSSAVCQVPSCDDGVQNGAETGVDCGGPCAPCVTCARDADCPAGDTCASGFCHAAPCAGFGTGTITCGIGACQVTVPACTGGKPSTCTPGTPTAEVCGDGIDNDCNGEIDDGCPCVNGATQPCYTGSQATLGVGACHGGTQTCMHGQWGACVGAQTPAEEVCDGIDNDCNGEVDDGLGSTTCGSAGCSVTVQNCVGGAPQTCNPGQVDGQACNDGNACTRTDVCKSGVCTGTNPVSCAASDQCHVAGTCNTSTGQCSNPAAPNGTACNDGNACTRTDVCESGVCTGTNPVSCAASDPCHVAGTCDTSTGQCSNPAVASGTACPDDGNPCTGDVCDGSGTCTHPAAAVGTACGSGLVCNTGATCISGCYIGGALYTSGAVNPNNPCQTCNPAASTTTWTNVGNGVLGCDGVCGSGKVVDSCGVCGGNNAEKGCDGVCNSGKVVDSCGVCGGNNAEKGCDGVCNSGKVVGCDGVCGSGKVTDACGVCGGNGNAASECSPGTCVIATCGGGACHYTSEGALGCDGVCGSGKVTDACGVCGGNGNASAECSPGTCVLATCGSGTCHYTSEGAPGCDGVCGSGKVVGCDHVCGSGKVTDACGVCGGSGNPAAECSYDTYCQTATCSGGCHVQDKANGSACYESGYTCGGGVCICLPGVGCDGVCGSGKVVGCDGVCGSGKVVDSCGVCGGNNAEKGCDGVCNSGKVVGCDGVCGSGKVVSCGVCGGCVAPQTCGGGGVPNVCGSCTPNPNACANQCAGTAPDGCGGTVACHTSCGLQGACPCRGGVCSGNYCQCFTGTCD